MSIVENIAKLDELRASFIRELDIVQAALPSVVGEHARVHGDTADAWALSEIFQQLREIGSAAQATSHVLLLLGIAPPACDETQSPGHIGQSSPTLPEHAGDQPMDGTTSAGGRTQDATRAAGADDDSCGTYEPPPLVLLGPGGDFIRESML